MSRRWRRLLPWAAISTAVAVTITTAAVGGSAPVDATQSMSSSSAGSTLVLDVPSVPTNLNPHTVAGDTAETAAVADAIWPQCYQVAPGLAVTIDSQLLDSAEVVSVDPQTVVYRINPKAVWSDGTPIRAADFVYLWRKEIGAATAGPDTGSNASVASDLGYRDIASVTPGAGGTTVTVVFRTPYADWADLFDGLVPPQVATSAGWSTGFGRSASLPLVSGGPWEVTAWIPGQRLELSPNPRWWGPKPLLGHIVLRAVGSTAAMAGDLAAGRAQAIQPASFDLGTLDAVSSLVTGRSSAAIGTDMLQLAFNTSRAPVDQVAVRQGLAHLVDRSVLVHSLIQRLDPLVGTDGDFLAPNVEKGYVDNGRAYLAPEPTVAQRLLASAGVTQNAVGADMLGGQPLHLTLTWAAGDPWSALVGPQVAADLEAAGVSVTTEPVAAGTLAGTLTPGGAWDLAIVSVPATPWPSQLAPAYSPVFGARGVNGVTDWSGFDDPTLDNLFAQASAQLAADSSRALYQQIDQLLWTELPALPLFAEPVVAAWSSHFAGIDPDYGGDGLLWESQNLYVVHPVPHAQAGRAAQSVR